MGIISKIISGFTENRIEDPTIGFLNLAGEGALGLMEEDKNHLEDLFFSVSVRSSDPPRCNVLFLYCDLKANETNPLWLLEIARSSGAVIIIIANENDSEYCLKITNKAAKGVNLVMTLDRKGTCFAKFFRKIFELMLNGATMPTAWAQLAPQYPKDSHQGCPETFFFCGAGQIAFENK